MFLGLGSRLQCFMFGGLGFMVTMFLGFMVYGLEFRGTVFLGLGS